MTIGVRLGMRGLPNADGVALATVLPALAVTLIAACVRHDVHGARPFLLAAERDRPGHLRGRGLLLAAAASVLFATRDNVVRALHGHASPETAAAATLISGTFVALVWARRTPTRRGSSRRSSPPNRSGASDSRTCSSATRRGRPETARRRRPGRGRRCADRCHPLDGEI
jgi:hypothetical protein